MNSGFSRTSTDLFKRGKRKFAQWLTVPVATITTTDERLQARLVSRLLIVVILGMGLGSIAATFILHETTFGRILAGMVFGLGIAFVLSRTPHYRLAVPIQLIVYAAWPFLSIGLEQNYSLVSLLYIIPFSIFTVLLGSALSSYRAVIFLAVFNTAGMLLLPVFISAIPYTDLTAPIFFYVIGVLLILAVTNHRNEIERGRLFQVAQINEQLQAELTERKRMQEMMTFSATHDTLTNLPNRVLFMDRLHHVMERTKRHGNYLCAVLFLDLDRFKAVNDTLGHHAGDRLLIECATRLQACLRSQDTVARVGGDEFVILLEDIEDLTQITSIADRIQAVLALPYVLDGRKIFVFASIGIVPSVASYERPDDILRDADIAMYRAKGQGLSRYEIFDPVMFEHMMTRLDLETDLRKALERQEFIVHYQPIQHLATRRLVGFEALVRWHHPTRGLLMPAEFISIAEETGLIVPIGYWVLDEACRQIRAWQLQFSANPPLTVSVNLSPRQCAQPDLVQKVAEVCKKNELDASCLKLELTESMIVENPESTSAMLSALRELGIQALIDGFGTGYSSLSYLHTLPIDTLKIDRVFVNRLETTENGSDIVRTILALAHNLGMQVVAEGVETDDQLSKLTAMGCEYVQGFLLAKPVGCLEASALLAKSLDQPKN